MPLTLEQYATYLDTRDLTWPQPPEPDPPKARPHLVRLPQVRAVTWNVYGTLLSIFGGELLFQHPNAFVMSIALDKTVQEFKMWASMSRKPGQPSEYMKIIYDQVYDQQRLVSGGPEKYPEVLADRVWEAILKKLFQKDYKFDANFFGSLNEYSQKVAYFFHASLQGTACYPGAAAALHHVSQAGLVQGLCADGQCFTTVQLQRGLAQQASVSLDDLVPPAFRALSFEVRGRKPSERLFRHSLQQLAARGITPDQVLHVGSRLTQDITPAKRLGMRTALFAGDKNSLQATPEQLKESASRPDVLLTELEQIAEVVG
jgi:phosphoglycolate phosphatase-like HAD superfamily hydrolase